MLLFHTTVTTEDGTIWEGPRIEAIGWGEAEEIRRKDYPYSVITGIIVREEFDDGEIIEYGNLN